MKPSLSFLRSSLSLSRLIQTTAAAGAILAGSTAHAVDYYKANNTTSLTSTGSWWQDAAGTTAAAAAPTNTTTSTAVCTWNNLVTGANTIALVDVGMQTLRILDPGGLVTLDGGATLNKTLSIANGGTIDMSNATQDLRILNLSTATDKGLRLAGSNAVMNVNVASGRTLTVESKVVVNGGSSGATVNFSGAGTSIFTSTFAPSNVTISGGEVQFNNAAGSTRIGGGNTTVTGGKLVAGNTTSGSATGTGPVTISGTGIVTGQGSMAGLVTVNNGGILSPGLNGTGTLTAGSLTLAAGSTLKWEGVDGGATDLVTVSTANGLTLNGGTVELYNAGAATPFTGIGTFNLFAYNGALGGNVSNLTIAESSKIPGNTYTIGLAAGFVTVRIEVGSRPQSFWNLNNNGTWATLANWTSNGIPNGVSKIANLGGFPGVTTTAPRTVTLGAAATVGVLNFNSAQPFTLAGTNALTFDDDTAAATLHVESGSHTISAPVFLTTNGVLASINAATTLTIQGDISGDGGVNKSGPGTLVLTTDNFYGGITSIGSGVLQLGAGGTTGSVVAPIANSGTLRINHSGAFTLGYQTPISGTGNVDFAGPGTTTLSTTNTFTGTTTISAGAIDIADPSALQDSTLNYSTPGGNLSFSGGISSLVLGGLTGNKSLSLSYIDTIPEIPVPVSLALTVGQNNQSTSFAGSTTDGTTFTKTGTGTLSLSGTHVFSGATTINGGVLSLDSASDFTTPSVATGAFGGAKFRVNGGTLHSTGSLVIHNTSAGFEITGGTATFTGNISNVNAGDSGAFFVNATGGTLNAANMTLTRGGLKLENPEPATGQTGNGLYINGGAVNLTGNLNIGNNANSSVSTRMDSGSLTVNGATTVSINNPDRWSVLDIAGGTFTSTDATTGVRLGGTSIGQIIMRVRGAATVAKAERIQFAQTDLAGSYFLDLADGKLFVGAGGMVLGSANGSVNARLRLAGGVLGATADSTSTVPVSLTGSATVTGADALDAPHAVTFSGNVDGTGSLTKSGSGTANFTSATNSFSGAVSVTGGTLGLAGQTGPVSVSSGATLIPSGTLNPQAASTISGTLGIRYDASNAPGHIHSQGVLTLAAGSSLNISGTGTLANPAYVIASGATGVSGTFTTVTGVPSGYSLVYNYNDGSGFPAVALVAGTASPYDSWATSFSLSGGTAGKNADPDFDGVKNLIEFGLGTNPSQSSPGPVVGRSGNFLTLTFPHIAGGNLTYIVEGNDDLNDDWVTAQTYPAFPSAGTTIYTDTVAIGTAPRRMLRLRIVVTN